MSKAVERALDILFCIGKSEQYPTMSDICRELAIPKASASDIIHTLMDRGFVRFQDPGRMTLALGERILQLGGAYRRQTDSLQIIHEEMEKLSDQTGRPVFFWVQRERQMMLMDRCLSRKGVCPNYEIGREEPMEGVVGRAYRKEGEETGYIGERFMGCYARPVRDVSGKRVGVLSTYGLAGGKEAEEKEIFEELKACAEKMAGKISVDF